MDREREQQLAEQLAQLQVLQNSSGGVPNSAQQAGMVNSNSEPSWASEGNVTQAGYPMAMSELLRRPGVRETALDAGAHGLRTNYHQGLTSPGIARTNSFDSSGGAQGFAQQGSDPDPPAAVSRIWDPMSSTAVRRRRARARRQDG